MNKKFLKAYQLDRFNRFNNVTQVFAWSFLAFIGILTLLSVIKTDNPLFIYGLLLSAGLFFLAWYRFFPKIDTNIKILMETLVFTLLISVLVRFTGGLYSYFTFLYYLVILGAVARTTFNNTLIIALGVSLAIISNAFNYIGSPDLVAVSRQVGILLLNQFMITFFAVYLTREIEDSSKKYYEEETEIEKIKEQDRLKDEFVFIASHELRAPITTMKGYLELVLKEYGDKLTPDISRPLKIVFEDANHLSQLVDDLLNVARIEAGKFTFSPEVFSICELTKRVTDGLSAKAKEKKIALSFEQSADLKIKADSGKVEEIVANLVDNAIKYTPEFGKVAVSVVKDGKRVVVAIKDNGLGIPEDFKKHIFEKFSRVERPQPGMQGTGLGLFIVKQLVHRMGGEIWFESTEGKGSTFSFSFPLV